LTSLRIVSWNINSVRLRLPAVERLVAEAAPDVLCLQEIKVDDARFPAEPLAAMGFEHQVVYGNPAYHGVAILSRVPLDRPSRRDWCGRQDGRHVSATLPGGIELHNFYIPSGGDIPDPAVNDKFAHKLEFLDDLAAWSRGCVTPARRAMLVGDLNVAPLETDVWSHKQLLTVVSHTPIEVEKLTAAQEAGDWIDAVRRFVPPEQKLYSWWSYRARDWEASDRGRRLDHAWVTPALAPAVRDVRILRAARGWEQPSDHVPVVVDVAID
jgi:exodeoxyribonuclease III